MSSETKIETRIGTAPRTIKVTETLPFPSGAAQLVTKDLGFRLLKTGLDHRYTLGQEIRDDQDLERKSEFVRAVGKVWDEVEKKIASENETGWQQKNLTGTYIVPETQPVSDEIRTAFPQRTDREIQRMMTEWSEFLGKRVFDLDSQLYRYSTNGELENIGSPTFEETLALAIEGIQQDSLPPVTEGVVIKIHDQVEAGAKIWNEAQGQTDFSWVGQLSEEAHNQKIDTTEQRQALVRSWEQYLGIKADLEKHPVLREHFDRQAECARMRLGLLMGERPPALSIPALGWTDIKEPLLAAPDPIDRRKGGLTDPGARADIEEFNRQYTTSGEPFLTTADVKHFRQLLNDTGIYLRNKIQAAYYSGGKIILPLGTELDEYKIQRVIENFLDDPLESPKILLGLGTAAEVLDLANKHKEWMRLIGASFNVLKENVAKQKMFVTARAYNWIWAWKNEAHGNRAGYTKSTEQQREEMARAIGWLLWEGDVSPAGQEAAWQRAKPSKLPYTDYKGRVVSEQQNSPFHWDVMAAMAIIEFTWQAAEWGVRKPEYAWQVFNLNSKLKNDGGVDNVFKTGRGLELLEKEIHVRGLWELALSEFDAQYVREEQRRVKNDRYQPPLNTYPSVVNGFKVVVGKSLDFKRNKRGDIDFSGAYPEKLDWSSSIKPPFPVVGADLGKAWKLSEQKGNKFLGTVDLEDYVNAVTAGDVFTDLSTGLDDAVRRANTILSFFEFIADYDIRLGKPGNKFNYTRQDMGIYLERIRDKINLNDQGVRNRYIQLRNKYWGHVRKYDKKDGI